MARRLIITVGTSLFHSASWRREGAFETIAGYEQWLAPPYIVEPAARKAWAGQTAGAAIAAQIEELLTADPEAPELVGLFDSGFHIAGQYSAEISTLIAMRLKLNKHVDFPSFLRTYASIVFLHGSNGDPTEVAARHMAAVLRAHTVVECRALDGRRLQDQLESLVVHLKAVQDHDVDLVATGGYKAFAMALAHIYWLRARDGWRLFYLHESDTGDLIQEWRKGATRQTEIRDTAIVWREIGPDIV